MIFSLFPPRPRPDPDTFEREALVHLDALYRTARRLSGHDRDAEDLVQETYMRAFRFFHQFQPGTNCRAWLMRILHNVYINAFHRRSRAPLSVPLEGGDDYAGSARIADESQPGPEQQILDATWDTEIRDAMGRLPVEYRTVVLLSDVEELSYKEIASTLRIPIGTVRSRLARGRRLLQKTLFDYVKERKVLAGDPAPQKAP